MLKVVEFLKLTGENHPKRGRCRGLGRNQVKFNQISTKEGFGRKLDIFFSLKREKICERERESA